MKVLIVDDDDGIREILCEDFKERFDCWTARNGREASEMLAKNDFDIVITDINMPNGGGERVLTEIASKQIPKVSKVYVYSGGISEQDRETYRRL